MRDETMPHRKLLVVQVAALGHEFLKREIKAKWKGLEFRPLEPVFPAVTCTAQASFRTAAPPREHGMIANGIYHEELQRPMFWEQSSRLVTGPRIWEDFRKHGKRVALMFWQQSLGEDVDIVLSPAPIHKHHGGMIPLCYGKPAYLYDHLCSAVGREFSLAHYWGPLASAKSGDWIADATAALLSDNDLAPDLCFTYLPTLDYDLQRHGPDHDRSVRALEALSGQFKTLVDAAQKHDYHVVIFGDYAIGAVDTEAVFPNRALLEAGLLQTRQVKHMLYPDFYRSRAFAVVDHEVAHVYIGDGDDVPLARECLTALNGIGEVLDRAAQTERGLDHPRSGELVIVAQPGTWFAYPWWQKKREAPEYAKHVDIHNKPGYDPCELFFGRFPTQISTDTSQIKGSHGRVRDDRLASWASTCDFETQPKTLLDLATAARDWLGRAL